MVHAHYLEDADGHGYYVTAAHGIVSDGRFQVYIHPPFPIMAWLVPDREAAERWIAVRLHNLGHVACGGLCHSHEGDAQEPMAQHQPPAESGLTLGP
jgi:hypothetical protein